MRGSRRLSLESLAVKTGHRLLLSGVGTGLDVPNLPAGARAVGLDLTPEMLLRARHQARRCGKSVALVLGDAERLPFRSHAFDAAALHLILAVVPHADAALREAVRTVKPRGALAIFDKFLRAGETAGFLRSAADAVLRPLGTGLNTCFEALLPGLPVTVERDEPDLLGGAFRRIALRVLDSPDAVPPPPRDRRAARRRGAAPRP